MVDLNYTIKWTDQKGVAIAIVCSQRRDSQHGHGGRCVDNTRAGHDTSSVSTQISVPLACCFARSLATVETHTVSFGRGVSNTLHAPCD
jgi:hypothetical protein